MATETETAAQEIAAAWASYQQTEKYGLEFGRVCCEWRDKFKSKGGYGTKEKGLEGILTSSQIPKHIAYYWMERYESVNKQTDKPSDEPSDEPI